MAKENRKPQEKNDQGKTIPVQTLYSECIPPALRGYCDIQLTGLLWEGAFVPLSN